MKYYFTRFHCFQNDWIEIKFSCILQSEAVMAVQLYLCTVMVSNVCDLYVIYSMQSLQNLQNLHGHPVFMITMMTSL